MLSWDVIVVVENPIGFRSDIVHKPWANPTVQFQKCSVCQNPGIPQLTDVVYVPPSLVVCCANLQRMYGVRVRAGLPLQHITAVYIN